MEVVHMKHKESKFAPKEDVIGSMPDNVITNILDRLPLQDAVRTSILSKTWTFKWTLLSKLVFDPKFFACLSKTQDKNNHVKIITRILFQLRGAAITKAVVSIDDILDDVQDTNYWMSRYLITDLTFAKFTSSPLPKLSTHLFSCLWVTSLKLVLCRIHPPLTTFHGFPNLLSLELSQVQFESMQFGEFITLCPALEILKTGLLYYPNSKVKSAEIAKLTNLKTLSLVLFNIENMLLITSSDTIFELFGFFPKLQELHLDFLYCKVTTYGTKKRFPTAFPCLRALKLSQIDLGSVIMLSCVFEMIRHLPNLQTLEIIATSVSNAIPASTICSPKVDYNDNPMGLSRLQSVVFVDLKGSQNEVCLIKYLLGCSPFIKKIAIRPHRSLASNEELMFISKLLKLQRAYPDVAIDLDEFWLL